MPRSATDQKGWGNHNKVVTGSQDGSKQVSKNEWNDSLNDAGLLGFTKQSGTIAGNAIVPTGSVIEIQADGTLNTLTTTNNNEFDLIYLIGKAGEDAITITHDASGGAGKIRLLSGASETLSTTTPMILMCRSISGVLEWSQYGGGIVNALGDIGDVVITSVGDEDVLAYDSTTSKWINQTADESGRVTASSTTTFTNKTIDADGTGNSITNIENANVKASAGIDATKLADGTVTSTELQYINTLSSNAQTQIDSKSATAGNGSLVTVGALDSGSITSGFGNINIGSSSFTTTGTVTCDVTGNADTVTTNANLTGGVTSVGNATTVVTNANLTGGVTSVGNATTVITNANLTGDVTSSGNATTIATDAVDIAMLSATGTASATTFLRGDNSWQTAGGGAENTVDTKLRDEADTVPTYTSRTENDADEPIQLWAITLDSNNENIYVRVKKNGSYTNVQIA